MDNNKTIQHIRSTVYAKLLYGDEQIAPLLPFGFAAVFCS